MSGHSAVFTQDESSHHTEEDRQECNPYANECIADIAPVGTEGKPGDHEGDSTELCKDPNSGEDLDTISTILALRLADGVASLDQTSMHCLLPFCTRQFSNQNSRRAPCLASSRGFPGLPRGLNLADSTRNPLLSLPEHLKSTQSLLTPLRTRPEAQDLSKVCDSGPQPRPKQE
mmetsp:Transcript_4161/g.9033  ORF Transcript_4161/g.9033 Transcript_4161/m.9033 type:complete len:174 (-) Transcript_4161:15-536(-)